MTWTYSGDPNSDEKDLYRFLIGDTDVKEPILQDAEIEYVIGSHPIHNERLYYLYDACAQFFARKIKRTIGPIKEEPWSRQRHYEIKAAQYKKLISGTGFKLPTNHRPSIFKIGMNDNV